MMFRCARKASPMLFLFMTTVVLHGPVLAKSIDFTQKGRMSIGGSFLLPIHIEKSQNVVLSAQLVPEYSYFVIDNLALSAAVKLQSNFFSTRSLLERESLLRWGSQLGLTYYLPLRKDLYFFVGTRLGFSLSDVVIESLALEATIPMGVMLVVSQDIGLNLGINTTFFWNPQMYLSKVDIVPGFLGISAYF